jgi:hypothetical protein
MTKRWPQAPGAAVSRPLNQGSLPVFFGEGWSL